MTKLMILILPVVFLFAGCDKITADNYEKIEMGMERGAIEAILGEADECSRMMGAERCIWGDDSKYIKIKFLSDKVAIYSSEGF